MTSNNDIDKKIIKHLKKVEWPVTTEDVANSVGVVWHTAQVHLMKLRAEGKVKFRRVGRQNQWWLKKKHDKEF